MKIDEDNVDSCLEALKSEGVKAIVLTLGEKGLVLSTKEHKIQVAAKKVELVNVTGAGDSLASGIIHKVAEHLRNGGDPTISEEDLQFGIECAKTALECEAAVNPAIATLAKKENQKDKI